MSDNDMPVRLELSEWKAQLLRLTAFLSTPTILNAETWWSEIVGEEPQRQTIEPKEQRFVAEGDVARGRLILTTEVLRIDLRYTSGVGLPDSTIAPYPKALDDFLGFVNNWFSLVETPPINRLAFGAVLLSPVDTREEGYGLLDKYLPGVEIDPENSMDFLYQINRRRDSQLDVQNLQINRLSKWSVAVMVPTQFQVQVLPPELRHHVIGPAAYNCRLEVDINTAPEYEGALPADKMGGLFSELVEFGEEIIMEGDIP